MGKRNKKDFEYNREGVAWISPPFEPEINLFGLSIKWTEAGWKPVENKERSSDDSREV